MSALTAFHADIKNILEQARGKVCAAVNAAMVEAYWLMGRRIVQEEQLEQHKAEYGTRLLENLSKELSESFGNGFSYADLRNFRQFYLTYPDQAICYAVCSKLSWSHLRLIMRIQLIKRSSNKVKYMVIRVLSYNGEDIDTPISDEAIRGFAISVIQHAAIKLPLQLDLFN